HRAAPARRFQVLWHHSRGWLQTRPVARQRHHGAAVGRGGFLSASRLTGSGHTGVGRVTPQGSAKRGGNRAARGRSVAKWWNSIGYAGGWRTVHGAGPARARIRAPSALEIAWRSEDHGPLVQPGRRL